MRWAALLSVCVFSLGSSAAVYKWQGPDGQTVFSDRPQEGAEEIEVRPVQTVPAHPVSRGIRPADPEASGADEGNYRSFEILSPKSDASIRDNAGNVEISLLLDPALQADHIIRFLLDGQPFGEGVTSTAVTLTNVDRGSHNLTAIITTTAGEELVRTEPITFHLHRVSKLITPPRPAPVTTQ